MTAHDFRWNSREETLLWGRQLGTRLKSGDLIALIGDLGTGKTTLTQGIAQGLGIRETVTSPTFTLLQEYQGRIPLFHCDPYRLYHAEDLFDFGFEEYFERGGVIVMEWADKVESLLPPERLTLTLSILPSDAEEAPRQCHAVATGAEYERILSELWETPELQALREEKSA